MEVDGEIVFFNEVEAVSDLNAEEPEDLERLKGKFKKTTGKKEGDIAGLPVNMISHYMNQQELTEGFGENGWKQLPDVVTGYTGICVTDGYQVYHTFEKEIEELCREKSMSHLIMKHIQAIYHLLKIDLSSDRLLSNR